MWYIGPTGGIIVLDLRLYKNILVDYVVYHFLRYRAKKVVLDHIDWFFLNRPVMGQMGPYETFSTWSQESQCWEIKFDDLGILLDSLAIDHLLDWDNHLITTMILEYGIDWDNHWQSPTVAIFWDHWRLRNLIRDLRCKSYEIYRFSMMFMDFHEQKGKSLRLQNSSKRPQNPSKRPQKPSSSYKSQKLGQSWFLRFQRICFKTWYFHKLQPNS